MSEAADHGHSRTETGTSRPTDTEPGLPLTADTGSPRLPGEALDQRLPDALGPAQPRYRVAGMLGSGASGEVYELHDLSLDRRVAAKMLHREAAAAPEDARRFVSEARLTAALTHPNVLPVHDIELTAEGRPFFTMARIDGSSLASLIETSTRTARAPAIASHNAVISIAIDICHALAYAHDKGIVHQDVKPENVMVGAFGEVLLLDWGSAARIETDGSVRQRLYGTPLYMSPEQARHEYADRRSDCYCVGGLLLHALLLRPPTWSDDLDEFWRRKRAGALDPLSDEERRLVPAPLIDIALKALAADPAARYQGVAEMARDLSNYQAGLAVSAHRYSLWSRLAAWHRRHWRAFWVASCAGLMVSSALWLLWREKLKERWSWTEAFSEDFTEGSPALGQRWMALKPELTGQYTEVPLSTSTSEHAGVLRLAPTEKDWAVTVATRVPLFGNLRIEWDYRSVERDLDLNCVIGGRDRYDGYHFNIAAWEDPRYRVLSAPTSAAGEILAKAEADPLELGRWYHFVMERRDGRVALTIDGRLALEALEARDDPWTATTEPQYFGFETMGGRTVEIRHVRAFVQPLRQRLSPLAVGDELTRVGKHAEAAERFAQVAQAYPGTRLAVESEYRAAAARARAGNDPAGSALSAFLAAHPGDELVPFAARESLRLALARGDDATADRMCGLLAAHPGHVAARAALRDLSEAQRPLLKARPLAQPGDRAYPLDAPQRIVAAQERVRRWGGAFGVDLSGDAFMRDSMRLLLRFGQARRVAELSPDTRVRGEALSELGRFDEVMTLPHLLDMRLGALLDLGRYGEVIAQSHSDFFAGYAYYRLGELDELARNTSFGWLRREALNEEGRYDEVIATTTQVTHGAKVFDPYQNALLAGEHFEQVLQDSQNPMARSVALANLGRSDEIIAAYPGDPTCCYLAAFGWAMHGDRQHCDELLARLAAGDDITNDENLTFARYLLPGLLAGVAGRRDEAQQRLAGTLDLLIDRVRQRPWHYAVFMLGRIDAATFRAQPERQLMESRMHLAEAMRADLLGDSAAAAEAYRAYAVMPGWTKSTPYLMRCYIHWRLKTLTGMVW
jgi:serine/threonine protein kinase